MSLNSPIRTFGFQIARAAVAALTIVLISRWLGAEGRGELSVLLFYVQLIMVANEYVGGGSLGNLVVRYPLSRLFAFCMLWALLISVAGSALVSFSGHTSAGILQVLWVSLPLAWLTIQFNLNQGLAMVHQRNIVQLVAELLKLIMVIILGISAGVHLVNVNEVVFIYGLASVAALGLSVWFLRNHLPGAFRDLSMPPAELFRDGFWAQNGQLIQFLNYRLSLLLLTELLGDHAPAGIYANALLIADTIWIFGNSFGSIAHMRILQSSNQGFRADITLRYAGVAVLGTLAACVLLPLLPVSWYTGIFGPDFEALKNTVLWLIPAILALGASTLFSHYIAAKGGFVKLFFANLSGFAVQLMLALALIPVWGLKGAAIAADAGFVMILIIVYRIFKNENPDASLHGAIRLRPILKVLFRS